MTTAPCVAVTARSTSSTSPSAMPASCIAAPAARITKVASGWRMSASLRSMRRTVESVPGEPKALDVRRAAGAAAASSRPARAPSSKSAGLVIHTVYRREAQRGSASTCSARRSPAS